MNFGFPLNINYESGDPSVHYLTSAKFAEEENLLCQTKDQIYGGFTGRKIGSYVNSGILMQCLSNSMDTIEYYKIFIVFGVFILFMTGAMMYNTLEKFTKTKWGKTLALIVSLIFTMGYPLNSLLFGFEYMSLGMLIIVTLIHMTYYFEKEDIKKIYSIIIFALLDFGLFCSYYIFVTFVYSALWIYFCIYSKRVNKKIICKENIIILLATLLIPFFLGLFYHLMPGIYNIFHLDMQTAIQSSVRHSSSILGAFSLDGYVYINYYSNLILLLPLMIYYLIKKSKNKENITFDIVLLGATLAWIWLMLIGKRLDQVSTYYVMKNYYALWIVVMYMNFRGLMYIFEKDKWQASLMVGGYTLLIIINLIFINVPITTKTISTTESPTSFTEIFAINKTIINKKVDFTPKEIEILKYARDNLDYENDKVEILGDLQQVYWAYALTQKVSYDKDLDNEDAQLRLSYKCAIPMVHLALKDKVTDFDYLIYFNRCDAYQILGEKMQKMGEKIYENEVGGILKLK